MPTVPPTLELLGGGNPEGDPPDSAKIERIIEIATGSVDTPLAPLEGFSVRTPPTDAVLAPTSNPPPGGPPQTFVDAINADVPPQTFVDAINADVPLTGNPGTAFSPPPTFVGATGGGGGGTLAPLTMVSTPSDPALPEYDPRRRRPGGPLPSYAGGGLVQRPSYAEGGLVQPGGPPQAGLAPQGASQQPIGMQGMEAEMQRMVQEHPQQILQMRDVILAGIQAGEVTMQEINMAVQLATAAAQNPQLWPQLRQFAIQQGLGTEQDIPQQYDEGLVFSLLLAARAIQQQGPPQVNTGSAVGQAAQGGPPVGPGVPQAAQGGPPVGPGVPQAPGQPVPTFMNGGPIPQMGQNADGSILAAVHPGEYVIPNTVVRRKGLDFFDKLTGKDSGKPTIT